MRRGNGGAIGKPKDPTQESASGFWSLTDQILLKQSGKWKEPPGAPTSLSATGGDAQAEVLFTAPAETGGSAITGYTVTSNPGGITASGSSSPITITGLTNDTEYTFTVTANNILGSGLPGVASNAVVPSALVPGQQAYTTPGTYSWVAPAACTSVSVVCVGGGGGGRRDTGNGGNGGNSYFISLATVSGYGGVGGSAFHTGSSASWPTLPANGRGRGGTFVGDGGGRGGDSFNGSSSDFSGPGGAGGYAGQGGDGGRGTGDGVNNIAGGNGVGGGGGGAGWGGAGGVGILGQGANGAGEAVGKGINNGPAGGGGSGGGTGVTSGTSSTTGSRGGAFGGGGSGTYAIQGGGGGLGWKNNIPVIPGNSYTVVVGAGGTRSKADEYCGNGGGGAVRIIWGQGRAFPSTNTGDV